MQKMMKEQFLKFFKNQIELQGNSFGDIGRECFFCSEKWSNFFERTRLNKKQKEKRRNKKKEKKN